MTEEVYVTLADFLRGKPRGRYGVCGNCQDCGAWRNSLHKDHKVPKSQGGSDDLSNIQYLCANCHQDKTNDDLTGKPKVRRSPVDPQKWAERSRKISIALTGLKRGPAKPEHIAARLAGRRRYIENTSTDDRKRGPQTEEHKYKISLGMIGKHLGRVHSVEARKDMGGDRRSAVFYSRKGQVA